MTDWDPARWMSEHECNWWGWWIRYPIDNLRRVWRNLTS